ncbi:MAG: hypothetical protein FJY83_01365 [Candidatus Aminicenantes bacterium]|nr:hypothetical protein [Candidatus Aminicenantes bacterium]
MNLRFLGTAACLGCLVLAAAAQEEPELDPQSKRELYREAVGREIRDPSLTSPVAAPAVDFQLTTEKKNRKAKAMVGLRVGEALFFDVKFIAPLGDADSEATPLSLDGLSRSSVVDLGFHFLSWRPRIDAAAAREVFEEYARRRSRPPGAEEAPSIDRASGPISLSQLGEEPDLREKFLGAIDRGAAYFAACRFKVGRQDFSYADKDLKTTSVQKTSAAVVAAAGLLTGSAGYFGLNLEYQAFYEGGEAAELILPFGEGGVQRIKKTVLGPPGRRERFKVEGEYRKALTGHLAVNPKLSYFPGERIVSVSLPVYLFRNPDEGLNGGVALGWTSRSGGRFDLGIFIGTAFSLFPSDSP